MFFTSPISRRETNSDDILLLADRINNVEKVTFKAPRQAPRASYSVTVVAPSRRRECRLNQA